MRTDETKIVHRDLIQYTVDLFWQKTRQRPPISRKQHTNNRVDSFHNCHDDRLPWQSMQCYHN